MSVSAELSAWLPEGNGLDDCAAGEGDSGGFLVRFPEFISMLNNKM